MGQVLNFLANIVQSINAEKIEDIDSLPDYLNEAAVEKLVMKFTELSDNSTALHAKYEEGLVSLTYYDRETDVRYIIKIKSQRHRSCFFSVVPVGLESCAKACVDKLSELLSVDQYGKYVLNHNANYLRAVRFGSIIALGLKAEEYPYFASIRMTETNFVFVSVPISSEEDITLVPF